MVVEVEKPFWEEEMEVMSKADRRSFLKTFRYPFFVHDSRSRLPKLLSLPRRSGVRSDNKSSNKGKGTEKLRSQDKAFNPKFTYWKVFVGKTVNQALDELNVDVVDDDVAAAADDDDQNDTELMTEL